MDEQEIKNVLEAALLAAGRPLTLDKLAELFANRGAEFDRTVLRGALDALSAEYEPRGIQLKEVASGYRIQVKASMQDWLQPLWEERAPRYTRALLETLALVAYRQPVTRAEIEEVRGVAVSSNIVRTLMERGWVRVVGFRDVPGKPSMLGTTREFLDYFGLKRLEDLPPLADIQDSFPELNPQSDFLDSLEAAEREGVQIAAGPEDRSLQDGGELAVEAQWPDAGEEGSSAKSAEAGQAAPPAEQEFEVEVAVQDEGVAAPGESEPKPESEAAELLALRQSESS